MDEVSQWVHLTLSPLSLEEPGRLAPPQGKSRDPRSSLPRNPPQTSPLKKVQFRFYFALLMWVKSFKVSTQFRTSPWRTQHAVWPRLGNVGSSVSWGRAERSHPLPVTRRGSALLEYLPHHPLLSSTLRPSSRSPHRQRGPHPIPQTGQQ